MKIRLLLNLLLRVEIVFLCGISGLNWCWSKFNGLLKTS